jgi:hypothetical protein
MTNREISIQLWKNYRQAPIIPANLGELRRGALRGVIGCVSSVHHLGESISSLISEGYKEASPVIQTLKTRMAKANEMLEQHERVLYATGTGKESA